MEEWIDNVFITVTIAIAAVFSFFFRRHWKVTLMLVFLAVGMFCMDHAFATSSHSPLYALLGSAAILAAIATFVFGATQPEYNYVDVRPIKGDDWFAEL